MANLNAAQMILRDQMIAGGIPAEQAETMAAGIDTAAVSTALKAERKEAAAAERAQYEANAEKLSEFMVSLRSFVLDQSPDMLAGSQIDLRARASEDGRLSVALHGNPKGIKVPILFRVDGTEPPTQNEDGTAIPTADRKAEVWRAVTSERAKRS